MRRSLDRRRSLDAQRDPPLTDVEWFGGRFPLPGLDPDDAPVTDRDDDGQRPSALLWFELPHGVIVGAAIADPDDETPYADTLWRACRNPGVGFPRRPRRIRIADAAGVDELEALMPDSEVVVAPVPELDLVAHELAAALDGEPDPQGSYLEGGSIPEDAVEALFRSAAALFKDAVWKSTDVDLLLRLELGKPPRETVLLGVFGPRGEPPSLTLFPSLDAYDAYLDATDTANPHASPLDMGSAALSLEPVRRDELPTAMRSETARHGWPVAAAGTYPLVAFRDRYGIPHTLEERDLRLVAASVTALLGFVGEHRRQIARGHAVDLAGVYPAADGLEIRVETVDDGVDGAFHGPLEPLRLGPKVGRNDPCPCGSGRKYKKCCLPADEARGRRA